MPPKRSRSTTRRASGSANKKRDTPRRAASPAQLRALDSAVVKAETRKRSRSRSQSGSRSVTRRRIGSAVERQYARESRRSSPYSTRSIVAAIEQPTLTSLIKSTFQANKDKQLAQFITDKMK